MGRRTLQLRRCFNREREIVVRRHEVHAKSVFLRISERKEETEEKSECLLHSAEVESKMAKHFHLSVIFSYISKLCHS